ncbi:MAG: hypothetical protein R6V23_03910 [Bacteroidales bacterium]
MIKHITLLMAIIALLFACNPSSKKQEVQNSQVEEDGSWIKKSYFDNGNLKSEITVKNKRKNGPAKKYYTTGELHTKVNYVNNIKEGEAVWYYKNGQPYRITQYKNNKITGVRKLFYEDGTLMAEIPYQNNEPVIGLKEYNKNGELLTNYPDITFRTKDLIQSENKFIIYCQLSNQWKKVQFYQELAGTDGKERLFEIPTKNGTGKLEFHIPARIKEKRTITIYAKAQSTMGNPYITKSSYTFSFDTN